MLAPRGLLNVANVNKAVLVGSRRGQTLDVSFPPQRPQVKLFLAWRPAEATSTSTGHSLTLSIVSFFF